ncbi:MAG TPA: DUF1579 family protein [Candidatus Acidoferrum sp.]|jgi:hypothetical protein|nr:DUF1579 family protein [Candidatus Acidoferrum sp.]
MQAVFRAGTLVLAFWIALFAAVTGFSQDLDGPKHIFNDALLDHMVGNWKLTGNVMGRAAEHTVSVEWVLNHQFLRISEKDDALASSDRVPYEAMIMVGYDNTSERYVAHWNDVFGGRFSETLGYGTRAGNEIRFVFEYPDGPFHTTFRWNPETHQWKWLMQQKNKSGLLTEFADLTLTSAAAK